ncbi:MAG: cyclase family protein [Acidobacteriota bacterium]
MPFIDLSATIEPTPDDFAGPDFLRTEIHYTDHAQGAAHIEQLMGVPSRLLRRGEGWTVEEFRRLGTHNTTHVDAPWHYNSKIGGEPAMTIDEVPLRWFFQDGVVLDMTHKADGDVMTADDAERALAAISYELKPLDIVLVRTDCDRFYRQPDYMQRGCGVSAEATHWLYERGVRVMGIDAWGWDRPLHLQAAEARERDETGIFWAAHQADLSYCQIERLVRLGDLPSHGFRVSCFPLKLHRGSGAPARVVAMIPDSTAPEEPR